MEGMRVRVINATGLDSGSMKFRFYIFPRSGLWAASLN